MPRSYCWAVVLVVYITGCASDREPPGGKSNKAGGKEQWKDKSPPPPCHPGCFPAGTTVLTPRGPRPIESLRSGELVQLVQPDGTCLSGRVSSTFETCNNLVEVRTTGGVLLTTLTQPLCLVEGSSRRAGELQTGDRIWAWQENRRRAVDVLGVAPTQNTVPVFNLVVGESAVFIAGGFLARGKPPAIDNEPTRLEE